MLLSLYLFLEYKTNLTKIDRYYLPKVVVYRVGASTLA